MHRRNFIQTMIGAALIAEGFQSCNFNKKTQQIVDLRSRNEMELKGDELIMYIKEFTDTHRKYAGDYYGRELACSRLQLKAYLCTLRDGDILVGRECYPPVGFGPQAGSSYLYYCNFDALQKLKKSGNISNENKVVLDEIISYWRNEDGATITRKAYSNTLAEVLPSDNWSDSSGIGFPLYRIGGMQLDYNKLITLGLTGMKKLILEKQESTVNTKANLLYSAMIDMLEIVRESIDLYLKQVNIAINETNDQKRKTQLKLLENNLTQIKNSRPETLYQGVQLMYLYNILSGAYNFGRMDDYLAELYIKDKANGITDEEQIKVFQCMWNLLEARNNVFDGRVTIGGKGRRNETEADQLASVIMESVFRSRLVLPQLTFRFYKGQNPDLYKQALDMLGQSYPFPLLYNDDVNIPAVMKAFRVTENEAEHYLPFGCGEYILNHRSIGTPSGVINMLQALLVTLNNGIDPTTGQKQGLALGDEFATFDDLFSAYKKQIEYYVDALAIQEKLEYDLSGQTAPFLLLSMLYDDCIERGKPILNGGLEHLGGCLESYGNTNTGDALTAIKYWVYDKKEYSLEEIRKALSNDFNGYEEIRKRLLEAPKYGNDDEYADNIMVAVNDHIFNYTFNAADKVGLNTYLIVVINNHANTLMGRYTQASPDGRLAKTYMANANNPTGGADKNGVTAMLNSIVKTNPVHAGSVQNIKFSKEMFSKQMRPKLEALLASYWANGGTQLMLNVLGRDDLENALREPDKYQNLIVRVGGFSARFVDLAPDVRQEILSRTLY